MKNADKWKQKRFLRDAKGRIIGTHMHKIIGNAYEPIILKYSKGILADIGCGDVPFYHLYKSLVTENICVDWPNSPLETSFLDFAADLNFAMDFIPSHSVDTVLCTDVMEHIYRPELLFSEMTRILKPGGHLIIGVPFLYWIHDKPHDHHRYTEYKLREFCKTNKLSVIELFAYGGLPEIMYDLVHKGYTYYNFPFRMLFHFFWKGIGSFLSRRKFIKKLSLSSRSTFPLGYVMVAIKE